MNPGVTSCKCHSITEGLLYVRQALRKAGLIEIGESYRHNSFYFSLPGFPYKLRISDHKPKKKRDDVLYSGLISCPMTAHELDIEAAKLIRVFVKEAEPLAKVL